MISRRQYFARMKKLGFSKSSIQMTRMGLTYVKEDKECGRVTVTVPKGHEKTFTILGSVPYSGIYFQEGNGMQWGDIVPADWCMLETCLGLCSGELIIERKQLD